MFKGMREAPAHGAVDERSAIEAVRVLPGRAPRHPVEFRTTDSTRRRVRVPRDRVWPIGALLNRLHQIQRAQCLCSGSYFCMKCHGSTSISRWTWRGDLPELRTESGPLVTRHPEKLLWLAEGKGVANAAPL